MLACYPGIAGDANAITQMRLSAAWMRRKQFEAKLLAVEVAKLFFGESEPERIPEDDMLRILGITPVVVTVADSGQ
mgnify:CR=1 FL=1